jgi:hypothetical protein
VEALIVLAVVLILYFLPTIIANNRGHQNTSGVFIINLLLGWSVVGWVIALVMAAGSVQQAAPASREEAATRERLVQCWNCGKDTGAAFPRCWSCKAGTARSVADDDQRHAGMATTGALAAATPGAAGALISCVSCGTKISRLSLECFNCKTPTTQSIEAVRLDAAIPRERPCPFCETSISVTAKKCRQCWEWVVPESERTLI